MPAAAPLTPNAQDLIHVLETVFTGKASVAAPKFGLGVTPVVTQSAITTIGNSATGTQIATAVNAIIAALQAFGFTA